MSALREVRLSDIGGRVWATRSGRQWVVAVLVDGLWLRGYGATYEAALGAAFGIESVN